MRTGLQLAGTAYLLFHCLSAPAAWRATGPFGGDAEVIRAVPKVRDMVVAASRNGLIYVSKNGGGLWENVFFPPQLAGVLHSLELDPRDAGTWYVGFEAENPRISGVYRTTNAGRNWELLPASQGMAVWSVALWTKNPDVIAAGAADGVFLSKNRGATWTRISPPGDPELKPVVSLAFHPETSDTLYAGTTHLPWKTTDGGATWKSIHTGMIDDSDVFSIQVDALKPERVFASACSGVYGSLDAAAHWKKLETPSGAFRTYFVAMDPRHTETVFAGTTTGLLKSDTGGKTFRMISPHAVRAIAFDPLVNGRVFFASSSGGLLVSGDMGATIHEVNNGFSNRNFTTLAGAGSMLYAGSVYEPVSGGLYRSDNFAFRWSRAGSPEKDEILATAAAPDQAKFVLAAGYRSLFESRDGGSTWAVKPLPGGARVNSLAALGGGVFLAGTTSGIQLGKDGAWRLVAGGDIQRLDRSGTTVTAIARDSALFSRDGGATWKACGTPSQNGTWYGLTFDPEQANTALAATAAGMFRSADNCATWSEVRSGLAAQTVTQVLFHPSRRGVVFAAQGGKVLISEDGGRRWQALDDEPAGSSGPLSLYVMPGAPDRLFALFPRRGILSTWLGEAGSGQ